MNEPKSEILMNFFVRYNAKIEYTNEKTNKVTTKKVQVIVFNQKNNPLTSVETIFGGFKNFKLKDIFSLKTLAVLSFLCIFLIFMIPKAICSGYNKRKESMADTTIAGSEY